MKGILGKKLGMTQIFTEEGIVVPVTVVEAGPNVVTQVKTVEKDGYNAIQVGFEDAKEKSLNKPQKGHLAAAKCPLAGLFNDFSFASSKPTCIALYPSFSIVLT